VHKNYLNPANFVFFDDSSIINTLFKTDYKDLFQQATKKLSYTEKMVLNAYLERTDSANPLVKIADELVMDTAFASKMLRFASRRLCSFFVRIMAEERLSSTELKAKELFCLWLEEHRLDSEKIQTLLGSFMKTIGGLDIPMSEYSWSKELVVEKIQQRERLGLSVSGGTVSKEFVSLYRAARRYFGTWEQAIITAGLKYEEIRRFQPVEILSRAEIIEKIIAYNDSGKPLSSSRIQETDYLLYYNARREYGSWAKAIAAAGFDYTRIKKEAPHLRSERSYQ
jgi:hypothetical protein